MRKLPIGLFGAGTGAAAALVAVADDPALAESVVCEAAVRISPEKL